MTLRGRLTAAFLATVLGPVLLGAFFVGATMTAVGHQRAGERLDLAAGAVRASVDALCARLRAVAGSVAVLRDAPARAAAATQLVARGHASAVLGTDAAGSPIFGTADATHPTGAHTSATAAPAHPPAAGAEGDDDPATGPGTGLVAASRWTDCATTGPAGDGDPGAAGRAPPAPGGAPSRMLAARVELRDDAGTPVGSVFAAQRLDGDFVRRLAAATGTAVTLLDSGGDGGGRSGVAHSTEPAGTRDAVLAAVAVDAGGATPTRSVAGRSVRRVGPAAGQPLPLVLSVPRGPPQTLYAVLLVAVACAGLFAVVVAWRLARSTTRPLAELAHAADELTRGNLAARVPVRAPDELERLARAFNRMTRETQGYVQALASSRDQLRRHLAVLGDTLAGTHDLQRILRVVLHNARAATGARAGVLLLLDPRTGELVGQCAEGLDGSEGLIGADGPDGPDGPDGAAGRDGADGRDGPVTDAGVGSGRLRVPLGSGLLGAVALSGEARRGRRGEPGSGLGRGAYLAVPFASARRSGVIGPRVPPPEPAPPPDSATPSRPATPPDPGTSPDQGTEPESAAAWESAGPAGPAEPAGTAAAGGTLGVLALFDRLGGDDFDDTDLATLRTFAGHAAVAVENVRVHEEAQRLSLTDPLTGLWNYRYLRESIRRETERANRFGRMLSVLALDLDRFKEVNDTCGHAAGDAVLVEFARRIRGVVREVDLVFRRGGEEFVVLLPETDAHGAATVAERLGAAVRVSPFPVRPAPAGPRAGAAAVRVTVSVGIAVYPDHGLTGAEVLDTADDALYAAKAAGRDTYRVAAERIRPVLDEIPVVAGAVTPADGLPWAGYRPVAGTGGASSGPHPPRPARGR